MDAEKKDLGQSPEKAMVTAMAKFFANKAKIPNPKDAEGARYDGLKGVDTLDTAQQAVVARVMDHIASNRKIRQAVTHLFIWYYHSSKMTQMQKIWKFFLKKFSAQNFQIKS